jgi:hypothetical protein
MEMKRNLIGLALVFGSLAWASNASGQHMTEQYIPVGQSPGVSGVYSYIGQVEAVDTENRTVTVAGPEGSRTIKVTDRTWIWLDRSQQKRSNDVGSMADLAPGRRVEVKYTDYETKDTAHWIKVVVPAGG